MRKSILKAGEFSIFYSPRRKRIAFAASPDGGIKILSPAGIPEEQLLHLVRDNRPLLDRLRRRAAKLNASRLRAEFTPGARFLLWGREYPLKFSHRVTAFDEAFIIPAGKETEVFAALERFYRRALGRYVDGRIREFSTASGLKFSRIRISGAETRWGSCSSSGTISFSWKLAQCPTRLIDYVIWHELTHLEEMNHSPRFWKKLENHCPGAREMRRELRAFEQRCPIFPER